MGFALQGGADVDTAALYIYRHTHIHTIYTHAEHDIKLTQSGDIFYSVLFDFVDTTLDKHFADVQ